MSRTSNTAVEESFHAGFSPVVQVLRKWSAPAVILAVTNSADEQVLLFHAVQQARRTAAKVLLVHVLEPGNSPSGDSEWMQHDEPGGPAESALDSLNRMARQLRWVGIACEPLLIRGTLATEIPLVAKAHGADRLLIPASCRRRSNYGVPVTLAEVLSPEIPIPVCTIGRYLPGTPGVGQRPGTITLALSLRSDPAIPLAFASRMAQECRAKLHVVHVFGNDDGEDFERTPLAVTSRLPAKGLREAELFCPLEITVHEGDPATEILKCAGCATQDFIVLGLVGQHQSVQTGKLRTVHKVISEARCPVIVLGRSIGDLAGPPTESDSDAGHSVLHGCFD